MEEFGKDDEIHAERAEFISIRAEKIYSGLRIVEDHFGIGDTASLNSAEEIILQLQFLLEAWKGGEDPLQIWFEWAASVATAKGHLERLRYRLEEASSAYELALRYWNVAGLDDETLAMRSANIQTYLGLAHLATRRTELLPRALDHFESSIRIRETVTGRDTNWRWAMSAAMINRGDALAGMKTGASLREAIISYEKGAALIEDFDFAGNTTYRSRYALCHQNIGQAMVELRSLSGNGGGCESCDWETARERFEKAASVLRDGLARGCEESRRMLAMVLTNKSRAGMMEKERPECCVAEAREALDLIRGYDAGDGELLTLDLTARLALSLALGRPGGSDDPANEISDIVEEGLVGVKANLNRGGNVAVLDPLIGQLFRCGAEVYLRQMPHFLAEFILDSLDPEKGSSGLEFSAACHEAAVEVLWSGIARLKSRGFSGFGTEDYDREMALKLEWDQCRERLAEIRATRFELS